jgi:hypothetical protein
MPYWIFWNICIQICYRPNVNVKIKMFMYQFNICQLYFIIFCNIFILFLVPLSFSQKTKENTGILILLYCLDF